MSTIINTGFQLATTVISNGEVTGNEWSNPNNILLTDGDVASSNPNQTASDVIIGNFSGANVPSDAVITGIEIELIGAYSGSPTNPPITLNVVAVNNISGSNIYYPYDTPQLITPTVTDYVLGSPTYLFNRSWTVDEINNLKLELLSNGDVSIDAVKLKVYYYVSVTPTPPTPIPGECDDCNSPIQTLPFKLALPFKAGDRYAYFESFNYPDGTPIEYADLGSCGGQIIFTFDPAMPKIGTSNFAENAKTAVWTVETNGFVKFDFGTNLLLSRGLQFHTPYAGDADLRSNHDQGAEIVISDNAPFLGLYLQRCQAGFVFSKPIEVLENGVRVLKPTTKFNFTGGGQRVEADTIDDEQVNIDIPGDGVVSIASGTSGNIQVTSLTIPIASSGNDRLLTVQVSMEQLRTITGITYDGIALTRQVFETDAPNNLRAEIWTLLAPHLGTHNVIISLSGASYITAGAEVRTGVDQAIPLGSNATNSGSDTNPTLAITPSIGLSTIVDALCTANPPITYTPGTGQVLNWSHVASTDTREGGSSDKILGSVPAVETMEYTIGTSTPWVYCALEIRAVASPVLSDGKVKVNGADTISDYLDPKIRIRSSDLSIGVVKTLINLGGGNLLLDYDLSGSGSGGSGGNIQIDQTPDNGTYGLLAGAVDGVNDVFTVSAGLYLTGKLEVFLNGLIQLQGASDDWQETLPGSGTFTFNTPPATGDIITVVYQTTAGTSTGESLTLQVNQVAHGFSEGEVLKSSGADNDYALAQANNDVNAEVVGIVTTVVDADNFIYSKDIMGYTGAGIPAGTPGEAVFLSESVPGAMTLTEPAGATDISKPLGVLIASATKMNFSSDYRGQENQAIPAGTMIYTNGLDTKDAFDASTVQLIPHGLGAIPKKVTLDFFPSTGNSNLYSHATYNGVTQSALSVSGTGGGFSPQLFLCLNTANTLGQQAGVITFDATNIIITWTKTGTASGIYNLLWTAETQ